MPKYRIAGAEPQEMRLDVAGKRENDTEWGWNLMTALKTDSRFFGGELIFMNAESGFRKVSDRGYQPSEFFDRNASIKSLAEAGRLFVYGANEYMPRQVIVTGSGEKDFAVTEPLESLPKLAAEPPVPARPSFWKYILSPFISRFAQEIADYNLGVKRHEDLDKQQGALENTEALVQAFRGLMEKNPSPEERSRGLYGIEQKMGMSRGSLDVIEKNSRSMTEEERARLCQERYTNSVRWGGQTLNNLAFVGGKCEAFAAQAKDMQVTPVFYLADDPKYDEIVYEPQKHREAALEAKARIEAMGEPAATQELARLAGKALEQNNRLAMKTIVEPGPQSIAHQNRLILAAAQQDPNRLGLSGESILLAQGVILRGELELKAFAAKRELMDALIMEREPVGLEEKLADIYAVQVLRNASNSPEVYMAVGKDYDPATQTSPELEKLKARALGSDAVKNMAKAFREENYDFIEERLHSRTALASDARDMVLEQKPAQTGDPEKSRVMERNKNAENEMAADGPKVQLAGM